MMRALEKEERVQRHYVELDEFELPLGQHVAKYNGKAMAKYWNSRNERSLYNRPNIGKRLWISYKKRKVNSLHL